MRSPTLPPIRMNAADTSASSAIADWTPLAVVSRSSMTAEIDTFIREVSTTRTNMAAACSTFVRGCRHGALSPGGAPPQLSTFGEPLASTPSGAAGLDVAGEEVDEVV